VVVCPSCQAELEPEADLCLECGEPVGDSPAAKLARADAKPPPPMPPPAAVKVQAAARPLRQTMAETGRAKRARDDEPEAVRCPGCGSPSRAARCPGCGAVLRRDD